MSAKGSDVRVAGAPKFSVGSVFRYHARRLGVAGRVRFEAADAGAPWYIASHARAELAPPSLKGGAYTVHAVFPHWGLSGDTWVLYRRR